MSDDSGFLPGLLIATIAWLLIFHFVICPIMDNSWKQQIETHGCGGYYLDANRDKQWNWKP